MEIRIKAWQTRNASARELSRSTARLLDEIEREGSGIVIVRHGRPSALLVPLEPEARRPSRRVVIEEVAASSTDVAFEMPTREDARRLLLEFAARAPDPYPVEDWKGDIGAFSHLELKGLIERSDGKRWLTADGERVAEALRSEN